MTNSFFITALGKSKYEETCYTWGDKTVRTRYAPAATAELLNLAGAQALVLVTPDVERSEDCGKLCDELDKLGLVPKRITISPSGTRDDLVQILNALQGIPEKASLFLDVTYGLRHLPFMYHAAVTFLSALKAATLKGIYYGAYELRDPQSKTVPLISIGHTFELIDWFQAVRTFRDSGDANAIVRLLSDDSRRVFQESRDTSLSRLKDRAESLAGPLGLGLPLEAGIEAGKFYKAAQGLGSLSPAALAARLGAEAVKDWMLPDTSSKAELTLDRGESVRELSFAIWLEERGDFGGALRVLREVVVNVALTALGGTGQWLDRKRRVDAERYLNGLDKRKKARLPLSDFEDRIISA
jgi:CRISPR-associated Csx2 family protein